MMAPVRRPFGAPINEPYDLTCNRCCYDTLVYWGPAKAPIVGVEVPCHWCDRTWMYVEPGRWEFLDQQKIEP